MSSNFTDDSRRGVAVLVQSPTAVSSMYKEGDVLKEIRTSPEEEERNVKYDGTEIMCNFLIMGSLHRYAMATLFSLREMKCYECEVILCERDQGWMPHARCTWHRFFFPAL